MPKSSSTSSGWFVSGGIACILLLFFIIGTAFIFPIFDQTSKIRKDVKSLQNTLNPSSVSDVLGSIDQCGAFDSIGKSSLDLAKNIDETVGVLTYDWTLEKEVYPSSYVMNVGDTLVPKYTLTGVPTVSPNKEICVIGTYTMGATGGDIPPIVSKWYDCLEYRLPSSSVWVELTCVDITDQIVEGGDFTTVTGTGQSATGSVTVTAYQLSTSYTPENPLVIDYRACIPTTISLSTDLLLRNNIKAILENKKCGAGGGGNVQPLISDALCEELACDSGPAAYTATSNSVVFSGELLYNYELITVEDGDETHQLTIDNPVATYTGIVTCTDDSPYLQLVVNTASVQEPVLTAKAELSLQCIKFSLEKTVVHATIESNRDWTIAKDTVPADLTELTLADGQSYLIDYRLTVSSLTKIYGPYVITGAITLTSTSGMDTFDPIAVTDTTTVDSDTYNGSVTVVQEGAYANTYSYTVSVDELPDPESTLVNVAKVTYANHIYYHNGSSATAGQTIVSATLPFDFNEFTSIHTPSITYVHYDECISVNDDLVEFSSQTCNVGDEGATVFFEYYYNATGSADDSPQQLVNVATITTIGTHNTNTSDSANRTVTIYTNGTSGCTLTQGYWKTHSKYGPAGADPTWEDVPSMGPDTTFFSSLKTWYGILVLPPQGNAYINLAHQYIAAKLNELNGADIEDVNATLIASSTWFTNRSMTATLSKSDRATAIGYASLLDNYNNGRNDIGPGHCSEDNISS